MSTIKENSRQNSETVDYRPINNVLGKEENKILEFFSTILNNKVWISVWAISIFFIAAIYTFFAIPTYRAETLLAPANSNNSNSSLTTITSQLGGLAALTGVNLDGGNNVDTAIATLKSRKFTEDFIRLNNLLPVLFEERWDEETKKWKIKNSSKIPDLWDAYKVFGKIRKVSQNKHTGLVKLTIVWKNPEIAAKWANGMISYLNKESREQAVNESNKNLEYLQSQLEKTSIVEIQQSIFGLMESEMKKAMLANASYDYVFKVIDPAVVPKEKISPATPRILVLGMTLGIFIGVFTAFIKKSLI